MIGRHSPPRKGAGMRIPKKYEPMKKTILIHVGAVAMKETAKPMANSIPEMMEKINESVAKLCPYEVEWLAKLMPKQSCKDGCKACWNKEIKEVKE